MKIALVHSFYSRVNPSGENQVVTDQLKILRAAGHEVFEFTRDTDFLEKSLKFYKFRTFFRVLTGIGYNPSREIRNLKPDITIIHNLFPNFGTFWLNKRIGPKILFLHNYRTGCARGTNFRDGKICNHCQTSSIYAFKFKCYRNSYIGTFPFLTSTYRRNVQYSISRGELKIAALSQLSADKLSKILQVNNLSVLSNPTPNFNSGRKILFQNRSGWVYAGRLTPEKGIIELISAWPNDYALNIFGDGPLRKEIEKLVLTKKNIVLHETISRNTLQEYLPNFTGAVVPSLWYEVDPLVYSEYLSAGLPVIASKPNAVSINVIMDGSGMAIDSLSTSQLENAIKQINANYDFFTKNARRAYDLNRSTDAWLKRFQYLVDQTISNYAEN